MSLVLNLAPYRYGNNEQKIWDISGLDNHASIYGPKVAESYILKHEEYGFFTSAFFASPFLERERVINGGMEQGNPPTGWSPVNNPEVFERATQKHSGDYSLHISDSTASYGGARQAFSYVTGRRYRISYWYYLVSGVLRAGTDVHYQTHSITGSWQYGELVFVASSDGYHQFINNSNTNAAEFYIDDVSLFETNETEVFGWSFDGADDYFVCNNSSSLAISNRMTWLIWLEQLPTTSVNPVLFNKFDDASNGMIVVCRGLTLPNSIFCRVNYAGTQYSRYIPAPAYEKKYCLAIVFDVNNLYMYINGKLVQSADGTNLFSVNSSSTNLIIGQAGNANYMKMRLFYMLRFNRCLSSLEIKNFYELTRKRFEGYDYF